MEVTLECVKLTGNFYFVKKLFGLVLYVEEEYSYSDNSKHKEFRKARLQDLFVLKLVQLMYNDSVQKSMS
jgi:hypothetical protein